MKLIVLLPSVWQWREQWLLLLLGAIALGFAIIALVLSVKCQQKKANCVLALLWMECDLADPLKGSVDNTDNTQ